MVDGIELRQSRAVPALLVSAGVVVGALLGWFGPAIARGLAGLIERTPLPVHGLIRLLGDLDHAWSLPILGGAGLVGGIALAVAAAHEAPVLEVTADHLEHRERDHERWVERAEVATAFRDGTDLVLLRPDGGLHARLGVDDLPAARLRDALETFGWPLREDDPFDADFKPWADGRPAFTAEENALLRRRRESGKDAAAVRALDDELTQADLVVRMRGGRLQARRSGQARGVGEA